jgi:hypothetical protein
LEKLFMQNQISITVKAFGIAVAALFVAATLVSSPMSAQAADLSGGYYADTSYSTAGSGGYYADTSYSTGGGNTTSGYYADTSYSTGSSGYYADTSYSTGGNTPTGGCTNCGGSTVKPAPTCTLSVNDASITKGQAVKITWTSSRANITRKISGVGSGLQASGSITLYPQQTTTYTGTFKGDGGTVTCTKTVTVTIPQAPTCDINASQSSITPGQAVTISWSSAHASNRSITNIGSGLSASGSSVVYPQQTTTYTGTFSGSGGTVTCQKTITVTTPQPQAPTCSMNGNPTTITPGQSSTLTWNSTNVSSVSINNIGSGLSANGSQVVWPNQTTTYTGTFTGSNGQQVTCSQTITVTPVPQCPAGYSGTYPNCVPPQCPSGYTGTYPNCVPPQQNNPSCSITINNYGNNYNNGYWQPNSAVTISWSSAHASWGTINNGLGNVNLSGSRTVYPNQTTTYTGTFYGQNGQSVTCSATVYINVPPVNPGTPYVTLSQTPYTGLELGPVGTVVYWGFIAFWCLLAAYLIAVKRVHNQVYASLASLLFGTKVTHAVAHSGVAHSHSASAHGVHVSYVAPIMHEDKTDEFILSQINRTR